MSPGSITTTLSATPVRNSDSVTCSRKVAALPPEMVLTRRSKARKVSGPQVPSAVTPTPFWNSRRAESASTPNRPSGRPAAKPNWFRRR